MGKTRNIALKDPYDRNLLETVIANQQMLLAGQQRIEQLIAQRDGSTAIFSAEKTGKRCT